MPKVAIGACTLLYPLPAVLVGANVDGKPNFSMDYPYGSMESARNFLDQFPLSPADKEQIAHGNAERLLGL